MEVWLDREDELLTNLVLFEYRDRTAREFMNHGLGRRLRLLRHCAERVFQALPMEEVAPGEDALLDATAFLQTFVINTFGAVDNMAHVWCHEANVRDERGRKIPRGWIGLRPQNRAVRNSLSPAFRDHLAGIDAWFAYLEDYRHALAHRIPLYIPPRSLDRAAQLDHARVQEAMDRAFHEDRERYFALFAEQRRLGVFDPWMMHSYGEAARPVRFHPQIVSDFSTTVEIGEHLLRELRALRG